MLQRNALVQSIVFLLGWNAFVFTAYVLLVGLTAEPSAELAEVQTVVFGAFSPLLLEEGLIWTLVTANFLHFSITHILFNMLALYQIGLIGSQFYASKKLFIIYMLTGFASTVGTYIFAVVTDNLGFISIGASGSIFGLVGLLVAGALREKYKGDGISLPLQGFAPLLLVSLLLAFIPNINWVAHLVGFLVGLVLGYWLILPDSSFENNARIHRITQQSMVLSLVIFFGAYALLFGNIIFELVTIPSRLFGI